jgi:hypothetical protein
MNKFSRDFQKKFNNISKIAGLPPALMAKKIGFHPTTHGDLNRGTTGPSAQNFARIVKAFPEHAEDLLEMTDLPPQIKLKD